MKENKLVDLTKNFAVEIVKLCRILKEERGEYILFSQLLRSGTSIGANVHEGNYASSRADFINKLQIALKECYETDYWLEVFQASGYLMEDEFKRFHSDCSKIRKILTVSINTAKNNELI